MTTFPLIFLPTRIVYVDDKGSFLEVLRRTHFKSHARQFFNSPLNAIDVLSKETDYWRGLERLLSGNKSSADETRGFATKLIANYFNDWSRFHLTTVLTVDYAMPGIDGLEMVRRISSWPGRRILLTGEADAAVAIEAFNKGLIQRFIPKSTPNLYRTLKAAYEELHRSVCEHMGYLIRPTLSSAQTAVLHSPSVVTALEQKIQELEWSEYIVVGKPFGILGMNHNGPLQWLQIETAESLKGLCELLEIQEYSKQDIEQVKKGLLLANMEIHSELRLEGKAQIVDADEISGSHRVFIGTFDLKKVNVLTAQAYGIDDIMTPLEDVRAQINHLSIAHRLRESSHNNLSALEGIEPFSSNSSVDTALQKLMETSQMSFVHQEALAIALEESNYSAALKSLINSHHDLSKAKNG